MGKAAKTLLTGVAIGALAALLFAPRSGKQTKELLHEKYEKIRKQLATELSKTKRLTEHQYAALVDRALELFEKGEATKAEVFALRRDLTRRWKHLAKTMEKMHR